MNKNPIFLTVFACVICLFLFPVSSMPGKGKETLTARNSKILNLNNKPDEIQTGAVVKPDLNFGKFPLYFITNKGQVDKKAKFYARTSGYTLWLTKEGLVFDSTRRRGNPKSETRNQKQIQNSNFQNSKQRQGRLTTPELTNLPTHQLTNSPTLYERDVSRLLFIGADKNPEIIPLEKAELKVNYFIGNDKSKWHCGVPTSMAVLYKSIYKNIDLKVYGIEKQIEYDWIVQPGGNPADIKFVYKNVKTTRIDDNGDLVIATNFGELLHKKPISYQENKVQIGGESCVGAQRAVPKKKRIPVDVEFKKTGRNSYGFATVDYDQSRELIIDPLILAYSTYLGGDSTEEGGRIAVDSRGYVYVIGHTYSANFPVMNEYQVHQGTQSSCDTFVTRIDPDERGAASLIYSTYLGGMYNDIGYGIAVDGCGAAYVTGRTDSPDFPTVNEYQTDQETRDAFVAKLDTTLSGTGSLVYSTYLGGNHYEYGESIAIDDSGLAYVTGNTTSTDFPTHNQYQGYRAYSNAFVSKLDMNQSGAASLIYSTYLGGNYNDYGRSIAVDHSGIVYVTGKTLSGDFPVLDQLQDYQGNSDAFVTKLDTNLSGDSCLLYSTYLGGEETDIGYGIAVDNNGNAYVTGETWSMDFPTRNEYQTYQGSWSVWDEYCDAFVTRLDTRRSGAESLVYSTYLAGYCYDTGYDIEVDGSGNAYVTGTTYSPGFPIRHEYQSFQGYFDVFLARLDTNLAGDSSLIYSTFLGGDNNDVGYGIALDGRGTVYVTGLTYSSDFPEVNEYQTDQGGMDAFVTKLVFAVVPKVTTMPAVDITQVSAVSGGNVRENGGTEVTARGVCWSTYPRPNLSDNHTANGSGTGKFTSHITGLTPNTTYYVRAYATNSIGTGYGRILSFKTLLNPVISGWVKSGSGTPVPDVTLYFNTSSGTVKTGPNGYYKRTVSYNWSGIVTPAKQGYIFNPASRTYDAVTKNLINQDYTAYYLVLSIQASRKSESAWIIGRQYGKIELGVNNPDNIAVAKYVIYRREAGGDYAQLLEIPGSQLQGGTYTHYDQYLGRDKTYTYQFKAFDTKGVTLGESNEKTI